MKVSLLTGGADKPYALGLLEAIISKGTAVDFIGSDEMSTVGLMKHKLVNFLNLRGNQNPCARASQKIIRVLRYYWRLLKYVPVSDSDIFHILWPNKFLIFDRTLLILYYKLFGKKVAFTAHNVDELERDGGNNVINRVSLKVYYSILDHIFVHSSRMKSQLVGNFQIEESKVSVIPFGINNTLPKSPMSYSEAKSKLNLMNGERVILFFGNIAPYKGLEYALSALEQLRKTDETYRLIICGQVKACPTYWAKIEHILRDLDLDRNIVKKIQYIPDEEVEVYFKAADVLVLPYVFIYQSGVLFLSYSFGLPVIAADVGSLKEDILEGKTGIMCRPKDSSHLAECIRTYFNSEMFRNLNETRKTIMGFGNTKYSWDKVGDITTNVYSDLIK